MADFIDCQQFYIPGTGAYASSKSAANQLITHFAFDEPSRNVKLYSFHPGAILTPLSKESVPEGFVVFEDSEFDDCSTCSRDADKFLTVKLPGDFAVWLAGPEADFLNGRFVWAQWDVDELIALKEKLASDPVLLTTALVK